MEEPTEAEGHSLLMDPLEGVRQDNFEQVLDDEFVVVW
jgi:hypothetical protein